MSNFPPRPKNKWEELRELEGRLWEAKREVALLTLEIWTLRQSLEATP